MPKQDPPHPLQQIEVQAFHAFREWPLWLVLRERELADRIAPPSSGQASAPAAGRTLGQPKGT